MTDLDSARELAARLAARVDLRDIRLFSIEGSLGQLPEGGRLSYSYDGEIEVQRVDSSVIVDGNYELHVREPERSSVGESGSEDIDGGDTEGDIIALKFTLAALYLLDPLPGEEISVDDFSDEELDAFGQTTGKLTLQPFARELIATMTGRMGLPSLHVPVLQIPVDKRTIEK